MALERDRCNGRVDPPNSAFALPGGLRRSARARPFDAQGRELTDCRALADDHAAPIFPSYHSPPDVCTHARPEIVLRFFCKYRQDVGSR